MNITITGRNLSVKDSIRDYAIEKIGASCKVMNIDPLDVEVELYVEKNPANPLACCCEVTLRTKNHVIRVEEFEEDLHAAIDVAAAKVERQLRKYKTKVTDRRVRAQQMAAENTKEPTELDIEALMAELSAEDEEIVRVKEIEFPPMTEEQALVQIDLLGHDFFVYTDRDTNLVNVLYRRYNGGYGLLKQKE